MKIQKKCIDGSKRFNKYNEWMKFSIFSLVYLNLISLFFAYVTFVRMHDTDSYFLCHCSRSMFTF